jgi:hypothetical protein
MAHRDSGDHIGISNRRRGLVNAAVLVGLCRSRSSPATEVAGLLILVVVQGCDRRNSSISSSDVPEEPIGGRLTGLGVRGPRCR